MKREKNDFYLIFFIENQIKNLNLLKFKFKDNKPFWFQKKKMKIYKRNMQLINELLDKYQEILLEEYLKLEQIKK